MKTIYDTKYMILYDYSYAVFYFDALGEALDKLERLRSSDTDVKFCLVRVCNEVN